MKTIKTSRAVKCQHTSGWFIEKNVHLFGSVYSAETIADFILADWKRVVEPLVKLSKERNYIFIAKSMGLSLWHKAVMETLKNAGVEL